MKNFLESVLPPTGNYVVHTENRPASRDKWHKNFHAATIDDVVALAAKLDANPEVTVFYALGAFENNLDGGKVGRKTEHAVRFKTLAFDVDPKDKDQNVLYADQPTMAKTTLDACAKIGLPDPVFVSSGNGLHCYFPLTEEISRDMWVMISTMLRAALLSTGMALDTSKVCDPTMVLRPIGTHNKKAASVKLVRLLTKPITLFDPLVLAAALKKHLKTVPGGQSVGAPKKKSTSSFAASLIDGSDFPPADAALVALRCNQMAQAAQTGGAVHYMHWWYSIGVAKHCVNGREVAHAWSNKHPKYSAHETDAKYDSWTGSAPRCDKIEGFNPAGCAACPHKGGIATPVQLGVSTTSDAVEVPVGVAFDINTHMPRGYAVKGDCVVRTIDDKTVTVSEYLIYPYQRYKDHATGKSLCAVMAKLPVEGWKPLDLPMDTLSRPSDFQAWLINHQLFVHSEALLTMMRRYMLTYLQELQLAIESDILSDSFGWEDEDHKRFILGDRIITADGTRPVRLTTIAEDYAKALVPKGGRESWVQATSIFNDPELYIHGLFFLMSVSSPLIAGSGLKNVLVNLYSKNSGSGKTTTGLFASSMYGAPEKMKLTVKDTDNALFKTMGVFGNLPVLIDEITDIEQPRLGQILYFITQGREKKRMTKEGGFQDAVEWESIAPSTSNKDLYSITGSRNGSDGEAMRILQFNAGTPAAFRSPAFGHKFAVFLRKNYGTTGEEFVRAIMQLGGPFEIYEAALADFPKRYGFEFEGKERYWQAPFVSAYAAGKILTALGLIKFDFDECLKAGFEQVRALRAEFSDAKLDCFDTLGWYLGENAGNTVVHIKNPALKNDGHANAPYPREAVARVEVICTDKNPFVSGKLFINQVHLSEWANERGVDRKALLAELEREGVVIDKNKRIALMRGTDKVLPAIRVIEIEMTHPRFSSILRQNSLGVEPHDPFKIIDGGQSATGTD